MSRAHLYKSVQDGAGNLRLGASVRVLSPGTLTPVSATLYSSDSGTATLPNPFTIPNGTIDLYTDTPMRVRLGITVGGEPEFYVEDIDVLLTRDIPTAADVPFAPVGSVASTDVQAAIAEVASENAPYGTVSRPFPSTGFYITDSGGTNVWLVTVDVTGNLTTTAV